jgi:hypothetical protein
MPPSPSWSSSHTARSPSERPTRTWLVALAVWLVVGAAAALSDLLPHLPQRALPIVIWLPVLVGVAAFALRPSFRAGLATLNVRAVVFAHGIRALVGAAFVVQAARGVLPDAFGRPVGWGDIAAGVLAMVVATVARPDRPRGRSLLYAWNIFGFLDILMAFVSAQRLIFFVRDPRMAEGLGHLPLSFVPWLLVPFVLASHLWLFGRLLRFRLR